MELQTLAVLVAIASPVIMTAVTWGTYKARLAMLERRVDALEAVVFRNRQGQLL
ncbi:MAG: hypothetical protein M3Y79_11995 [Pseudomonadota bacterium]|nr:hypothetical protein [Pseudomonadota bacterium]